MTVVIREQKDISSMCMSQKGAKRAGDYYVDKDTGKVYRYTKDNKIMEY